MKTESNNNNKKQQPKNEKEKKKAATPQSRHQHSLDGFECCVASVGSESRLAHLHSRIVAILQIDTHAATDTELLIVYLLTTNPNFGVINIVIVVHRSLGRDCFVEVDDVAAGHQIFHRQLSPAMSIQSRKLLQDARDVLFGNLSHKHTQ